MRHVALAPRRLYVLLSFLLVMLAPATARAVPIVALMDFNRLVQFDSSSPGTIISSGLVTGIIPGDRLIAIDFRPATGQLYGFSTGDRLYVIDPQTRAVIRTLGPISPTINGNAIALDFDPSRDRLRVINDDAGRQNFLVDPDPATGGGVSVETPSEFAPDDVNALARSTIHGLAYDNNFLGAAHSRLWAIHRGVGSNVPYLVTIAPAGGGQIRTVGPVLGVTDAAHVTSDIGFDIAPVGGSAYAVLKINSPTITVTHLYEVNLATGAATQLGAIGEPGTVTDIAVVPPPLIVYAVNEQNELIKFNSATPSNIISRVKITGLLDNEEIYDIDFRPTTDFRPGREELYGLGRAGSGATATSSRIYVINPETGVAAPPSVTNPLMPALAGVPSFDFNPIGESLRVVTSTEQNLMISTDLGELSFMATPLAYVPGDPNAGRDPNVLAAAHSNNFPGATSTTLYVIDRDQPGFGAHLSRVGDAGGARLAANSGRMFTVAQSVGFGVPVDDIGFDIAPGVEGTALLSTISMDEAFSRLSVFGTDRAGGGHVGPIGQTGALERLRDLAVAPTATFRFETDITQIVEDCTSVAVNVLRVGDASNEATVDYATVERMGAINQRRNYTAARGTLHFAAGQTSAVIKVLISEDAHLEKGIDHGVPFNGIFFELMLTNPSNGHTLGDAGNRFTNVHVLDDEDTGAEPNPINDSHTFVCQHYHDFLGREPDAAGLAFWTNNIESCGASAACRAVKRIETSAAFFLSIEFQQTGFLVYRTHAAAFGSTRVGGAVPLALEEFLFDTERVARGVIVGPGDWQARLENNRRAYFDEFTQRPAFEAVYPRALAAAGFVDALNANTSGSLAPAERDALAAGLETGAETRATVLRKVVENAAFRQRELNRAFVLTQYFGYLRRNPNDFPDSDFSGYNFWLAKLNQFGGDFRAAEMVKAFITSGEYKSRFGNP
ncbi:MAG TPA: DUF4394 domain-containing protein [Pyrinomonadaceae bacterium]